MKAKQIAFGQKQFLAPSAFRAALKRAFPESPGVEPLDCWFDPRVARVERNAEGAPVKRQGCWSIWQRVRTTTKLDLGEGAVVTVCRYTWMDIMRLDGSIPGLPFTPGAWTIRALKQADVRNRWARQRLAELDRINAEDVEAQAKMDADFVADVSKDKILKRILAKETERLGAETLSGDQRAAARAARAKEERADEARLRQRVIESQFYRRS